MDASSGRAETRNAGNKSPDRKGSPRGRGEPGPSGRGSSPKQANDTSRKRPPPPRYVGWGDGIERAYCLRAGHLVATTFPVATHPGAATIPATVVARRPDALLYCTFDHLGAHVWPDGEVVAEETDEDSNPSEPA